MSKKKKKKQKDKRVLPKYQPKDDISTPVKQSNIKKIICVDCPKDPYMIIKYDSCVACEHHKDGTCNFTVPKKKIAIVSPSTPMKFNRSFFASASEEIANSTRSYYLHTPIMHDVKNIKGYPNYSKIRGMFLLGEFRDKQQKDNEKVFLNCKSINPLILMYEQQECDPDMIIDGKYYKIEERGGVVEGEFEVLYYFYDMWSLDGFADIQIRGRWYKIKTSPIKDSQENLVLIRQNNTVIIGERKK